MKNSMKFLFLWVVLVSFSYSQKERSINQKSVPQPRTDTTYSYSMDIHKADSGYTAGISTSMYYGVTILDGELTGFDAGKLFFGYDSTIIQIGKVHVVPVKIGKTVVFLKNPDHLELVADSIEVEVTKVKNKYSLQTHRAP
jgi:hypothetical protein